MKFLMLLTASVSLFDLTWAMESRGRAMSRDSGNRAASQGPGEGDNNAQRKNKHEYREEDNKRATSQDRRPARGSSQERVRKFKEEILKPIKAQGIVSKLINEPQKILDKDLKDFEPNAAESYNILLDCPIDSPFFMEEKYKPLLTKMVSELIGYIQSLVPDNESNLSWPFIKISLKLAAVGQEDLSEELLNKGIPDGEKGEIVNFANEYLDKADFNSGLFGFKYIHESNEEDWCEGAKNALQKWKTDFSGAVEDNEETILDQDDGVSPIWRELDGLISRILEMDKRWEGISFKDLENFDVEGFLNSDYVMEKNLHNLTKEYIKNTIEFFKNLKKWREDDSRKEGKAVEVIQRAGRGYLARKMVKEKKKDNAAFETLTSKDSGIQEKLSKDPAFLRQQIENIDPKTWLGVWLKIPVNAKWLPKIVGAETDELKNRKFHYQLDYNSYEGYNYNFKELSLPQQVAILLKFKQTIPVPGLRTPAEKKFSISTRFDVLKEIVSLKARQDELLESNHMPGEFIKNLQAEILDLKAKKWDEKEFINAAGLSNVSNEEQQKWITEAEKLLKEMGYSKHH